MLEALAAALEVGIPGFERDEAHTLSGGIGFAAIEHFGLPVGQTDPYEHVVTKLGIDAVQKRHLFVPTIITRGRRKRFIFTGPFFNATNAAKACRLMAAGDPNPWQTLWDRSDADEF